MPVSDYQHMLRDGSEVLDATENCVGVLIGAAPYQPIKARVYVPSVSGTSPTLDIHFEESDALGSGYADVPGATVSQITAAGTYEAVIARWTKPYLRAVCTLGGTTPNFGATTIGFTPGNIPTT